MKFLEENLWDHQPVEDEEEPDFDQIVAQNLTDQQFIEENVQLPTSEPAPEVVIAPPPPPAPAPEPVYNQPQDRGPQPGQWTPPVLSQPEVAPPMAQPFSLEDNWLVDQILQQQQSYQDTQLAINSMMPTEALLDERMTPERLDQLEQHRGYGVGPLAGLNYQIAEKNTELNDLIQQLDAMNPENFTTQAQIDTWNNTLNRAMALESEISAILPEYADIGNELLASQENIAEGLTDNMRQFNQLYGPGGLIEQRRAVARHDTRGAMQIDQELYKLFEEGWLDFDASGTESTFNPSQKLIDADNAYRSEQDAFRKRRQIIELGATSEQFSQFRDDPGFQQFVGQLTTMDAPDELLEELGQALDLDGPLNQIAARTNPYGEGKPVPLQTDLLDVGSFYRQQQTPTMEQVFGIPGGIIQGGLQFGGAGQDVGVGIGQSIGLQNAESQTLGVAGGAIGGLIGGFAGGIGAVPYVGDDILNVLDTPGRWAAEGTYRMLRDLQNVGTLNFSPFLLQSASEEHERQVTEDYQRLREEHPWIVTGTEVLVDPLNFVTGAGLLKLGRVGRFSGDVSKIRGSTSLAVEDAISKGTRIDADYTAALSTVAGGKLSAIDSIKLGLAQDRFATVAQSTLKVSRDEAKIFANRMTMRMHANPSETWGNILNEELGRLADRTGRGSVDAKTAETFNAEVRRTQAFSTLDGNAFWKEIGQEAPSTIADTPQWRRIRQQELPDPDDITSPGATQTPQLDNLVAAGHGPKVALDERWGDHAEVSTWSDSITPNKWRVDYLLPTPEGAVPPAEVTDSMMDVLDRAIRRKNAKSEGGQTFVLETRPVTHGDYWNAWRDLLGEKNKTFAPTLTARDIQAHPSYRVLYANKVGDISQGIVSRWADDPVDMHQITTLIEQSYIQKKDLVADLLARNGVGAPASRTRYQWIRNSLPATRSQKAQLRKLAKKQKRSIPDSVMDSMTTWDALDWRNELDPKRKHRDDLAAVGMDYTTDLHEVARYDKDRLFKVEHRAIIGDLLLPSGEGRYTFSRPAKRPDGTTANGWARLSEWELLDALSKAGPELTQALPNYGPAISQIQETVKRIRESQTSKAQTTLRLTESQRGRSQKYIRKHGSSALEDARSTLNSIIDEITQTATPAETWRFKNWLVDMYESSYVPRPVKMPNPKDYQRGAPKVEHLNRSLSELAARQTERASMLDQKGRFRYILSLSDWDGATPLNWNRLTSMNRADAVKAITSHFRHANAQFTLDDFKLLMAEAMFRDPTIKKLPNVETIVDEMRSIQDAQMVVLREINEWGDTAQKFSDDLGMGPIDDLTSVAPEPNIRSYAEQFGFDYEPSFAGPLSDPANRRALLEKNEDSIEVAYAARGSNKPATEFTQPTLTIPRFDGAPAHLSLGKWEPSVELNQRFEAAFTRFNQRGGQTKTVDEIAYSLLNTNIPFRADDTISKAMIIHGYSRSEIANAAGISERAARDLRKTIADELKDTGYSTWNIADDAKGMREAITLADAFYGDRAVGSPSPLELVAGKLRVPEGVVNHLLSYLDDQYKLSLIWQPSDTLKAAGKTAREWDLAAQRKAEQVLGTVLDYFVFGVTDRLMADNVMRVLGPAGAQYIQPLHQRPIVPTFDPWSNHLSKIQWSIHGSAFDRLINNAYSLDEVWGKSARRWTPTQMREYTRMSKGVIMGDATAFIANTAFNNVRERVLRKKENLTDPYTEVMNAMTEIVDGTPSAQMLYGDMFDGSEEMRRWLTWARTTHKDGIYQGKRNWDIITDPETWGEITPHLSISKMPTKLSNAIFRPSREGAAYKRFSFRPHTLNRGVVAEDVSQLARFMREGENFWKDLGLSASEQAEAKLWREALKDKWPKIEKQLRRGVDGGFLRGVHVNDLDALFELDHLDPFDTQRFADNMGTVATRLEYIRLGYDVNQVALMLKLSQYVKSTLGFVWLRTAPRYVINNVFGNYIAILLNAIRSDRVGGRRIDQRTIDSLSRKQSSLHRHRMLSEGLAGTEFAWGGTATSGLNRINKQKPADLFKKDSRSKFDSLFLNSPIGGVARSVKNAGANYVNFNAKATDYFEIDARKRVWTNEYAFHYQDNWARRLEGVDGLAPELRSQLYDMTELADISKTLVDAGMDDATRDLVFRAYNGANTQAHLRAYHATKDVMRDYLVRNRFDNMLDQIFPYHFWMTKNLMFVTGTVLDRPSTIIQAGRIYNTWQQQWEGLPWSMRNKIHIQNVPGFLQPILGEEIAIRPNNMTNPAFFILPAVIGEMKEAWQRYDDMPVMERLARATAGGVQTGWEEVGYSAGPHLDALVGVLTSNKMNEWARGISPEFETFWRDYFGKGLNLAIRPQGFDAEILPLGGLEDAILWQGGSRVDLVRRIYTDMNRVLKGSEFTAGEVNRMGFIAYEMAKAGEISPEEFRQVQELVVTGRYTEINADPAGSKILDRMYAHQGKRAGINYGTALSFTEYAPDWKDATQANVTYRMLANAEDYIPYPTDATPEQKKTVDRLNQQIEELQRNDARELEINNFSPDALLESYRNFAPWNVDRGIGKIYKEARAQGIEVPQLQGRGPDIADRWAFGERNPETGEREGGAAPWLEFYWRANDNEDDIAQRKARDASWEERGRLYDIYDNVRLERNERYGITAPYFNQIDDLRAEEQAEIAKVGTQGLSDTAENYLVDQIMRKYDRKVSGVYDAAEADGVSLRGSGRVPAQTASWYDMSDSNNGDLRFIYEQMGITTPRDRDLITVDQAIRLNQVQDQVNAHTTWAMRQTVDALDLNPYMPDGTVNPRFARTTDSGATYFDRDLWLETIKRESAYIGSQYQSLVDAHRLGSVSRDGQGQSVDLMARPFDIDEFMTFATDDVLSKQSAWQMGVNAQLSKMYQDGVEGEEWEALLEEGIRLYGPKFGDMARSRKVKIDMDEVALTISNFYNGLEGDAKKAFEDEWGHLITDGGDIRIVDSEKLGYRDAEIIASRYNLTIPTYTEAFQNSRNVEALIATFDNLSKEQQRNFKESWDKDDTLPDSFITTRASVDEDADIYTFDYPSWKELSPEQVAALIQELEIPTGDLYFPDARETDGVGIGPRSDQFNNLLKDAAREKEEEVVRDLLRSGEAFLSDPEDIDNWQSINEYRDSNRDLYDAGLKFIQENGVSWQWLVDNLEPHPKEAGDDFMSLREFAEGYVYLLDESDYDRLINDRRKWIRGPGAEYEEIIVDYLDEVDPTVEDFKTQAKAGTVYGFEGDDLKNWQEFYAYEDDNKQLRNAAYQAKEETGMTWQELYDTLEDGPIKEYIAGRMQRIEDYDMYRLWDERADFFTTEYGQSIINRDPEQFAGMLPNEPGGSSGGGGGGGSRSSSPPRNFGASSSPRKPTQSSGGRAPAAYTGGIREIFQVDAAMATGQAPDAQQRYDVATEIADLIQSQIGWAITIFGENHDLTRLLIANFMTSIRQFLGENPTLELWNDLLQRLGGGEPPAAPSSELMEQPEAQELIPAD